MRAGTTATQVTRWALCLTLAYALLLQLVLGATAGTVHALDAGNPAASAFCAPSGQGEQSPGDAPHDFLCCALGCAASQPAPALDASAAPMPPLAHHGGTPLALSPTEAARVPGTAFSFEARGPPAGV